MPCMKTVKSNLVRSEDGTSVADVAIVGMLVGSMVGMVVVMTVGSTVIVGSVVGTDVAVGTVVGTTVGCSSVGMTVLLGVIPAIAT